RVVRQLPTNALRMPSEAAIPSSIIAMGYSEAIGAGVGNEENISHEDVIAHDDRVVVRWTSWGTHKGNLLGVPASGRPVKITGIDIFRVKDGKLAELWQNWDQ